MSGYSCKTTEDELLRSTTQTWTVISDVKGAVMHAWSKLTDFPAKFCFCKHPGGKNDNADGAIPEYMMEFFWKVPPFFWETVCFLLKFHVPHNTLDNKLLHIHIATSIFGWKKYASNRGCFKWKCNVCMCVRGIPPVTLSHHKGLEIIFSWQMSMNTWPM